MLSVTAYKKSGKEDKRTFWQSKNLLEKVKYGDIHPGKIIGMWGLRGRDTIQKKRNGLDRWANVNPMKFNSLKCMIAYLSWDNLKQEYRLGNEWFGSSHAEEGLKVVIDEKVDFSQQCAFTAQKASHIIGCLKRSTASRLREVILPLCSILMRPPLQYCIQL